MNMNLRFVKHFIHVFNEIDVKLNTLVVCGCSNERYRNLFKYGNVLNNNFNNKYKIIATRLSTEGS